MTGISFLVHLSSRNRLSGIAVERVRRVPVKYISATEMEKTLRPFAPDGGILRVDEARNLLVLSGSSRELVTMQDLVATFDVDWLAGMSCASCRSPG